jgi:hypothetical protein
MQIITGTRDFQALFQGLLSEIAIVQGQPYGVMFVKLTDDSFASAPTSMHVPSGSVLINGFRSSDSTIHPLRMDKATNSLQVMEFAHHEIHDGDHYEISDLVDLSINNVRDIRITTPDTAKWAHFEYEIACESETEIYLYEDITEITTGTVIAVFNNNRNSAKTPAVTANYIDNTSVANANSDTTVSTYIEHFILGAGKTGGATTRENEIILDQNKKYNIRLIATAAGYVNYKLTWYEHTSIA